MLPKKIVPPKVMPKVETVAPQEPINLTGDIDPRYERYQREVQKEIARVWRPPVGVSQGTECVLSVDVDNEGSVIKFELATKSEVLIYDLSVLQAAKDFKFGQTLWGNSVLITFRQ